MATLRRRLDAELVRRGLVDSRHRARQRIEAGQVRVSGARADKPARLVAAGEPIEIEGPPERFVSRGGYKLEAALDAFAIDVAGLRAVDVGASTGGFSDCLLQRGASEVVAVDVGHGQLHERLRADERVVVIERCNVRDLDEGSFVDEQPAHPVGLPAPLVVVDLSFISLRTVADALAAITAPGGSLVALVKPQFEAGRQEVSRGSGVVSDPVVWERVIGESIAALEATGFRFAGVIASPVRGASGNAEFLVHLRSPAEGSRVDDDRPPEALTGCIARAVAEVPPWP